MGEAGVSHSDTAATTPVHCKENDTESIGGILFSIHHQVRSLRTTYGRVRNVSACCIALYRLIRI